MFHAGSSDSARTNNEFFHLLLQQSCRCHCCKYYEQPFCYRWLFYQAQQQIFGAMISTLPLDVCALGSLGADGPVSMLSSDESDDSDELHRTSSSSNSTHGDCGIVVTAGVAEHIFNAYFSAVISRFIVRRSI